MAFARHLGKAISLDVLSRGRGSYIFDVELFIEMLENIASRDTSRCTYICTSHRGLEYIADATSFVVARLERGAE